MIRVKPMIELVSSKIEIKVNMRVEYNDKD